MNFIKNHKKFFRNLIIDLLIAIVIFVGIVLVLKYNKNEEETKNVKESEIIKKFDNYFNSKELKVIYISSSSDGYTSLQSPIIESIVDDYDLDYIEFDKDDITSDEFNYIKDKLDIDDTTPVIAIVKDKEVIDTNEGFIDGTKLVEFFIESGVLEKGSEYNAEKNLTIIDYDRFNELYNSNEEYILVLGQTSCSHCIAAKPVLSYVAGKNNIAINYIDLTNLSETEYNSLKQAVNDAGYTEDIGTPLTLVIKEKKIIKSLSGEATPAKFTKLFEETGMIK